MAGYDWKGIERYFKEVHNSVNSISDTDTCERDLLIPMVAKLEGGRGKDATLTENMYEHPSSIVNLRINETLQTGAVRNRTYRVRLNAGRLKTEPTGFGKFEITEFNRAYALQIVGNADLRSLQAPW